jgi:serine/threonine protein kinase
VQVFACIPPNVLQPARLVMELVDGGNLFDYVRQGKLSSGIARFIFKQVLTGVGSIHCKGFAHRDVKLENILIDGQLDLKNSSQWVKLTDFGFATSTVSSQG